MVCINGRDARCPSRAAWGPAGSQAEGGAGCQNRVEWRAGRFKAWAERRRLEKGDARRSPPCGRQQGHKNSKCHFYALNLLEVSLGICDNIRSENKGGIACSSAEKTN